MLPTVSRDAELIQGLTEENRGLKIQLLHAKTELKQLELGQLIVNSRLVVHRFGHRLNFPVFDSPLERSDFPMCYQDPHVEIVASTISRGLRIKDGGGVLQALIAYDGSLEYVAPDFSSTKKHVRNIETKINLSELKTT